MAQRSSLSGRSPFCQLSKVKKKSYDDDDDDDDDDAMMTMMRMRMMLMMMMMMMMVMMMMMMMACMCVYGIDRYILKCSAAKIPKNQHGWLSSDAKISSCSTKIHSNADSKSRS